MSKSNAIHIINHIVLYFVIFLKSPDISDWCSEKQKTSFIVILSLHWEGYAAPAPVFWAGIRTEDRSSFPPVARMCEPNLNFLIISPAGKRLTLLIFAPPHFTLTGSAESAWPAATLSRRVCSPHTSADPSSPPAYQLFGFRHINLNKS